MTPEFSRLERLDTLGSADRTVEIAAEEAERKALAGRFGLVSIEALSARFEVRRDAAGARAHGRVEAAVTQACTVTGEPLQARVDEALELRFVPEGLAEEGDEIELDEGACDTMFFTGGAIDLGEAAAETMALALDPFPRGPNAEAALRAAGVLSEEEAGPFGALAGLKDALKKN